MSKIRETDLYLPVKVHFETLGYNVKGEVGNADLVAFHKTKPSIVVELKTGFTLTLVHQAIERLALVDDVYVAVPRRTGKAHWRALKSNIKLCRRLGIGLLTVRMDEGAVEVRCEPGPYAPRKNARKSKALIKEFQSRDGDPNLGGMTRQTIVTAYRQDAVKIAQFLCKNGPCKASEVAAHTAISRARAILSDNHYGWFVRVERGIYALTAHGERDHLVVSS